MSRSKIFWGQKCPMFCIWPSIYLFNNALLFPQFARKTKPKYWIIVEWWAVKRIKSYNEWTGRIRDCFDMILVPYKVGRYFFSLFILFLSKTKTFYFNRAFLKLLTVTVKSASRENPPSQGFKLIHNTGFIILYDFEFVLSSYQLLCSI